MPNSIQDKAFPFTLLSLLGELKHALVFPYGKINSLSIPPLTSTCNHESYFVSSGVIITLYEWERGENLAHYHFLGTLVKITFTGELAYSSSRRGTEKMSACLSWCLAREKKIKIDAKWQLFIYSHMCLLYCTGSNESEPVVGVLQLWHNSVPSGGSNGNGWAIYCWAAERAVFGTLLPKERSDKQMERWAKALTCC